MTVLKAPSSNQGKACTSSSSVCSKAVSMILSRQVLHGTVSSPGVCLVMLAQFLLLQAAYIQKAANPARLAVSAGVNFLKKAWSNE